MTHYPDFDIEQAQALSFIMGCQLAQKAFVNPPFPSYTNILRLLLEEADRLADNCHMPEFTNHALPHICSIVQRASAWGETDGWIAQMRSDEAGYLLMALIVHDMGMLSQDANDLPDSERISSRKGMSDLSAWVRSTHVSRLPKLVKRLVEQSPFQDSLLRPHLDIITQIAASHSAWPWQKAFCPDPEAVMALGLDLARMRGLHAVVAVSDLLDEDSHRCDTATLIRHKQGSNLNIAHWIRHSLTEQVMDVRNGTVRVRFRSLPGVPADFDAVYCVLRNHYRLACLYQEELCTIGATIHTIAFASERITDSLSDEMQIWSNLPDFKYCLVPRLLSTFGNEAKNTTALDRNLRQRLNQIGMEEVDLTPYQVFLSPDYPRTDEERVLMYMTQMAGE